MLTQAYRPRRGDRAKNRNRPAVNLLFTIYRAVFGQGKTMTGYRRGSHEAAAAAQLPHGSSPTRQSLAVSADNSSSDVVRNPSPDASAPSVPSPSRTFTAVSS